MAPPNGTRDMTFQLVSDNGDGTYTVRPQTEGGGQNPYAIQPVGGSQQMTGFRAKVNGREVVFASERDAQEAAAGISELVGGSGGAGGGGIPELGTRPPPARQLGGGFAGFARTGVDAAQTVYSFFQSRNLRQRRQEIISAINAANKARDDLAGLSAKYPELVQVLLNMTASERDINAAALSILDEQITAIDITAGIGAVRVMTDLWTNMGGWDGVAGVDNNTFSTLVMGGALGLGIGLLLQNSNRRHRR